ncbi:hypothetical protein K438DRAFT_1930226 [Mycena galopus ATCC 62051]|nr:hypothetical protein K438DRAFT_1930226 [Mycena galopus ATCC 62051]
MAANIADEILVEILTPALRVSDEAFSATSETETEISPSLTPLPLCLFTLILRSKAQAKALAALLTASPTLGQLIRRLRLEGGYAISVLKILQASSNISDIFLSLDIEAPDNACGLCRGLQLIQPPPRDYPRRRRLLTPSSCFPGRTETCRQAQKMYFRVDEIDSG